MENSVATAEPILERKAFASFKDFFLCLRPHQWTKNLVIFAALLFSKEIDNIHQTLISIGAFGIFCLLSGAVYLVNDVIDIKQDRFHPLKKNRPIASGKVPPGFAMGAGIFLYVLSLALAFLIGPGFFKIALLYSLVS